MLELHGLGRRGGRGAHESIDRHSNQGGLTAHIAQPTHNAEHLKEPIVTKQPLKGPYLAGHSTDGSVHKPPLNDNQSECCYYPDSGPWDRQHNARTDPEEH